MTKFMSIFCIVILFFSNYCYGSEITEQNNMNIRLKEFRINEQGLTPSFNKNIFKYYLTIPLSVDNIEITAIPEDENSTVEITGNTDLKEGLNYIIIKVYSKNKIENTSYIIEVTKSQNIELANTNLENLAIENQLLNPPFASNITRYNVEISYDITNLNILAIPENENALVNVNGGKDLLEGENYIQIIVTSANNISKKVYEIIVYRQNQFETQKEQEAKKLQNQKLSNFYTAKKTSVKKIENQKEKIVKKYIIGIAVIVILIIIFCKYKKEIKKF